MTTTPPTPLTCRACRIANRAGRRFCASCGAPLAVPCAGCGFERRSSTVSCASSVASFVIGIWKVFTVSPGAKIRVPSLGV